VDGQVTRRPDFMGKRAPRSTAAAGRRHTRPSVVTGIDLNDRHAPRRALGLEALRCQRTAAARCSASAFSAASAFGQMVSKYCL